MLLAADGLPTRAIGRAAGCTTGTASKWRVRYAEKRLAGLDETGDRGTIQNTRRKRTNAFWAVRSAGAQGLCPLDGTLLAAALGDVDVQYVWRFLRAQKIDLAARKSWCENNDPYSRRRRPKSSGSTGTAGECARPLRRRKALDPGTGTQTRLSQNANGRALGGQSHDYKRNGTTTLFAAFEVATGKVTAPQNKRRRRVEFLDFMNQIAAAWPTRHPCRPRQPQYPQTKKRPLA